MSAIGSYEVLSRAGYAACLELASMIRTETSGKWMFKKSVTIGIPEFQKAWSESLIHEESFGFSGYALGWYLDAQEDLNGPGLYDQHSEPVKLLARVFTSAFPFEQPILFPELQREKLLKFGEYEFGPEDADGIVEALQAAHEFYREGMKRIDDKNLVVFVMR